MRASKPKPDDTSYKLERRIHLISTIWIRKCFKRIAWTVIEWRPEKLTFSKNLRHWEFKLLQNVQMLSRKIEKIENLQTSDYTATHCTY